MAEFIIPVVDQLRSELSYLPEKRRRDVVARLEATLAEIQPERSYTFGAIHKRITQYEPSENASLPVLGTELLHDLGYMLEHLSGTFNVAADQVGQPVYRLEQVSDMLDVPPATVRQWRHEGLIVRRYLFGAEKASGVREGELIRFLTARAEAASHSSDLRLPDADTKARLGLQAERRIEKRRPPLCVLVDELAAKHHLPREAVLLALRERDQAHPTRALFPGLAAPLTPEQKWEIHEARLAGESLQSLMERFDRDRTTILRIVRRVTAKQILGTVEGYVHHPLFDHPNAQQLILGIEGPLGPSGEAALPAFVATLAGNEHFTAEQELDLFRRYNYLKWRIVQICDATPPSMITGAVVEQVRRLRDMAVALRNVILEHNVGLVLRVAHRHAGRLADISELASDGSISLMRALEKFDFARGNRFSTYATWALMKNFAKTVPEENYRRERYATGQEEILETAAALSPDDEHEADAAALRQAAVLRALDKLSGRERAIIESHFGLGEAEPLSLSEIGEQLHITRERVRQIEQRALSKIRGMFGPER